MLERGGEHKARRDSITPRHSAQTPPTPTNTPPPLDNIALMPFNIYRHGLIVLRPLGVKANNNERNESKRGSADVHVEELRLRRPFEQFEEKTPVGVSNSRFPRRRSDRDARKHLNESQ